MKKVTETTPESKGAILWEPATQIKCYTLNSQYNFTMLRDVPILYTITHTMI